MTRPTQKEVEFHPDAWARFERAVSTVSKAPPQHRKAKKSKAKKHGKAKRQR